MHFPSTFSFLFLFIFLIISTQAQPVIVRKSNGTTSTKSTTQIDSTSQSNSTQDLLPDFFWWGIDVEGDEKTGRQTINATILIQKVLSWKIPITLIQFKNRPKEFLKDSAFFVPSISDVEDQTHKNVSIGSNFLLSCYDDELFNYQHLLNLNCSLDPTCKDSYFVIIVWGTVGNQNYESDGVLAQFCGIINVLGGEDCNFPNSPGCKVEFYQDFTQKSDQSSIDSGQMVKIGIANTYDDISKLMIDYGEKTGQQLTLPDGTLTDSSESDYNTK